MAVDQTHPPSSDIKKGDGSGYARLEDIPITVISACKNVSKKPSDELVKHVSSIIDFER